jgi:hypothetical protein
METAADLVSAAVLGVIYLISVSVFMGNTEQGLFAGFFYIALGSVLFAGWTIIVRLFTQIPICYYIRSRSRKGGKFSIISSMIITAVSYVIGYVIVGPVILILSEGDTSNIPDGRLLTDALHLVLLTFLPLFLGAVAAPAITYYLFGGVFEHPYRTPTADRD